MQAENTILSFHAPGYDLPATLFCGQSFSWRELGGGRYSGVAGHRAARVWHRGDTLYIEPLNPTAPPEEEAFWRHYFALDIDYPALLEKFSGHKKLAACVAHSPGMRVLHQPFFDTLLSFIISQNNHLARITGIAQRLRQGFGEALPGGEYAFPAPEALAQCVPEDLAPLRAGFRAKYLIDAARRVAGGEVDEARLATLPDDEARAELMCIHGVGVKVADCVLLYGLGRQNIVPMDVWMKRAMQQTFPRGMPRVARGMEGIAQQYIFCWARENL